MIDPSWPIAGPAASAAAATTGAIRAVNRAGRRFIERSIFLVTPLSPKLRPAATWLVPGARAGGRALAVRRAGLMPHDRAGLALPRAGRAVHRTLTIGLRSVSGAHAGEGDRSGVAVGLGVVALPADARRPGRRGAFGLRRGLRPRGVGDVGHGGEVAAGGRLAVRANARDRRPGRLPGAGEGEAFGVGGHGRDAQHERGQY